MGYTKKDILTLEIERIELINDDNEGLYDIKTRLFINGKQLGFISNLSIDRMSDNSIPNISIELLSDITQEEFNTFPDRLKKKVTQTIELIRSLEFVKVKAPTSTSTKTLTDLPDDL